MPVIDSDAHVVETERTWEYMEGSDAKYRPEIVQGADGRKYWMIEGKLRGNARGPVGAKGLASTVSRKMVTDDAKRYMEDIPGRIAHMDELGIDVQILYPTIYIRRMCDEPETEVALSRSYNRWLADIWEEGKGRLRWACMLPLRTIEEAINELHFSKEHGACGVSMRSIEDDRLLNDPSFFPLYEEAAKLDIPITVHIGNSNASSAAVWSKDAAGGTFGHLRLMSVAACHLLITNSIPQMFPALRWGFIEASAQWIPYMVHDLRRRLETRGRTLGEFPLKDHNIWVTCQTDDDLPYVLKYAGEDQILVGTDYGHQDQSSEIEAMRVMREEGGVEPRVIDKIMGANAVKFYGL
ncbi:MAG: amidohydrolase family protein [Chloroflexi bacterium]|nr:amidohydrolase family protein [Chloroflexota bacterium]